MTATTEILAELRSRLSAIPGATIATGFFLHYIKAGRVASFPLLAVELREDLAQYHSGSAIYNGDASIVIVGAVPLAGGVEAGPDGLCNLIHQIRSAVYQPADRGSTIGGGFSLRETAPAVVSFPDNGETVASVELVFSIKYKQQLGG